MPLQIRSTKLVEDGKGNATVELLISDNAEADKAVESLQLQVRLSIQDDSYLPHMQSEAMKRAKAILDEVQNAIRKQWNQS